MLGNEQLQSTLHSCFNVRITPSH